MEIILTLWLFMLGLLVGFCVGLYHGKDDRRLEK
jgi:hypothetical protein